MVQCPCPDWTGRGLVWERWRACAAGTVAAMGERPGFSREIPQYCIMWRFSAASWEQFPEPASPERPKKRTASAAWKTKRRPLGSRREEEPMEIKQRSAPSASCGPSSTPCRWAPAGTRRTSKSPRFCWRTCLATATRAAPTWAALWSRQSTACSKKGGYPAQYHTTDICDGCAQGHDGMNYILASREAICDMIEVHGSVYPWDGVILSASCDKSIPAQLKAAARLDLPAIFIPGGSMRPGPDMTTSLVAGDISLRQKRKDAITPRRYGTIKSPVAPRWGPAPSWAPPAPCSVWPRPWASPCPAPL